MWKLDFEQDLKGGQGCIISEERLCDRLCLITQDKQVAVLKPGIKDPLKNGIQRKIE